MLSINKKKNTVIVDGCNMVRLTFLQLCFLFLLSTKSQNDIRSVSDSTIGFTGFLVV